MHIFFNHIIVYTVAFILYRYKTDACTDFSNHQTTIITSYFKKVVRIKFITISNNSAELKVLQDLKENLLTTLFKQKIQLPLIVYDIQLSSKLNIQHNFLRKYSWLEASLGNFQHDESSDHDDEISDLVPERSTGIYISVYNIDIIDEYFNETHNYPFYSSVIYLIIDTVTESKKLEIIAKKLWKSYLFLHIVLIVSNSQKIYFFNPFKKNDDDCSTCENWGRLRELTNFEIYEESFISFNGFPIAGTYNFNQSTTLHWKNIPQGVKNSYSKDEKKFCIQNFCGFDASVFYNLAKKLNFNPYLKYISPAKEYFKIFSGPEQITANSRFVINHGINYDFLNQLFVNEYCVIAPKSSQIPQHLAVFNCFKESTWILLIIMNFIFGYFWQIFKRFSGQIKHKNIEKFHITIINTWIVLTNGSISQKKFGSSEKLFLIGLFFLGISINAIFHAYLSKSFSTISYYKDITTMSELNKMDFKIIVPSRFLKKIFGTIKNESDEVYISLAKNVVIDEKFNKSRTAIQKNVCFLETDSNFAVIKEEFRNFDGSYLLHLIEECPRFYYSSFMIRKGFPLKEKFNEVILRFDSSGLIKHWHNQYFKTLELINAHTKITYIKLQSIRRSFTIRDMEIAFGVLGTGFCFSIICFIIEIFF